MVKKLFLCEECKSVYDTEAEAKKCCFKAGFPKKVKIYVHGEKEAMYDVAAKWGLDDDEGFMSNFAYANSEVEILLRVEEDGTATIIGVDGYILSSQKYK